MAMLVLFGCLSALSGCSGAPPKAVDTPDKAAGKDVDDNKNAMPGGGPNKDK